MTIKWYKSWKFITWLILLILVTLIVLLESVLMFSMHVHIWSPALVLTILGLVYCAAKVHMYYYYNYELPVEIDRILGDDNHDK